MNRILNKCTDHNEQTVMVCYQKNCQNSRMICSKKYCSQKHSNHLKQPYKQWKIEYNSTIECLNYKKEIKKLIDDYIEKYKMDINQILNDQMRVFIQRMEKTFNLRHINIIQDKINKNFDFIPDLYKIELPNLKNFYEKIKSKLIVIGNKLEETIKRQVNNINQIWLENIQHKIETQKTIKNKKLIDLLPFTCKLELKYIGSQHGFITKPLYDKNIKGAILMLIQTKRKLFGGFSQNMFKQSGDYIKDDNGSSFLFSIDEGQILPIKKQHLNYSIKGGKDLCFGKGDLYISEQCHKGNINWAEIGRVYQLPKKQINNRKQWLGGSWFFKVLEYEIYQVSDIKKK